MAVVYYVGGPLHDREQEVDNQSPSITVPVGDDKFGTYYLYPVCSDGPERVFVAAWKGVL